MGLLYGDCIGFYRLVGSIWGLYGFTEGLYLSVQFQAILSSLNCSKRRPCTGYSWVQAGGIMSRDFRRGP